MKNRTQFSVVVSVCFFALSLSACSKGGLPNLNDATTVSDGVMDGKGVGDGSVMHSDHRTDVSTGDSQVPSDQGLADDGTVASKCGVPPVVCKMKEPACPANHVAEVDPCPNGYCPNRCYTGKCVPCASECDTDADCALVGFHGCCGNNGDCDKGCFWAAPKMVFSVSKCYFEAKCPVPDPKSGACSNDCKPHSECLACPHCKPDYARCEAGKCVSAWKGCEPNCMCK